MMRTFFKKKTAFLAAAVALTVTVVQGCSGLDMVNAVAPDDGVNETAGIGYGNHPRQNLDLYRPSDRPGPLPTILFFYGGSWKGGHKEDYAFAGPGQRAAASRSRRHTARWRKSGPAANGVAYSADKSPSDALRRPLEVSSRGTRIKTAMGWGTVPRHFGTVSSETIPRWENPISAPSLIL